MFARLQITTHYSTCIEIHIANQNFSIIADLTLAITYCEYIAIYFKWQTNLYKYLRETLQSI